MPQQSKQPLVACPKNKTLSSQISPMKADLKIKICGNQADFSKLRVEKLSINFYPTVYVDAAFNVLTTRETYSVIL